MIWRKRVLWWIRCLIVILFIAIYFSHPFSSNIPLGYDAWMYKSMVEAYSQLWGSRHWSELPAWINWMYPPLVGVVFGGLGSLLWWDVVGSWLVLRWVGWLVALLLVSIYTYTDSLVKSREAGLIALLFGVGSFVLYNLYWWWYIKQLLAGTLLLLALSMMVRKKYIVVVLMTVGAMLTQRPAIVLAVCMFLFARFYEADKKERIKILLAWCSSMVLWYLLYYPFLDGQVIRMIGPFLSAIDLPSSVDWFQAAWTFLTTSDYLKTNRIVLLGGVVWTIMMLFTKSDSSSQKRYRLHASMTALLLVRVFGQGHFFQRMFGYLDLFLLTSFGGWVWLFLKTFSGKKQLLWVLVLSVVWLVHMLHFFVSKDVIDTPIIEPQEFAFISEIDTFIDDESVIIVPSENYWPWILWWTKAKVVAPGRYSLSERKNRWWSQRQENWRNASAQQKCDAVYRDYYTQNTHFYVRLWSKQTKFTDMTGACFELIKAWSDPFHALYYLNFEKANDE